ncbi:hypothetical protein PInf_026464 [Phytophthora infestans]|nr:hypothetical protein PInf_026464 [Phytophthora infestans]
MPEDRRVKTAVRRPQRRKLCVETDADADADEASAASTGALSDEEWVDSATDTGSNTSGQSKQGRWGMDHPRRLQDDNEDAQGLEVLVAPLERFEFDSWEDLESYLAGFRIRTKNTVTARNAKIRSTGSKKPLLPDEWVNYGKTYILHNHPVNKLTYNQYPHVRTALASDLVGTVNELRKAGAKKKHILKYIHDNTHLNPSTQDVSNLIRRLKAKENTALTSATRLKKWMKELAATQVAADLGSDTAELGSCSAELGSCSAELGSDTAELGLDTAGMGSDTAELGSDSTQLGIENARLDSNSTKPAKTKGGGPKQKAKAVKAKRNLAIEMAQDDMTLHECNMNLEKPSDLPKKPKPPIAYEISKLPATKPLMREDEIVRVFPLDLIKKCGAKVTACQRKRRGIRELDEAFEIVGVGVFTNATIKLMKNWHAAAVACKKIGNALTWIATLDFSRHGNPSFHVEAAPTLPNKLKKMEILTSQKPARVRAFESGLGVQTDSYNCGIYVLLAFEMFCGAEPLGYLDKKTLQCLRYRYLRKSMEE